MNHTAHKGRSSTRPAFVLMIGRTVGFAISFAIPLALARSFTQEDFGTYREIFLIYGTVYILAQIGMAESLYYFVPRAPESAGRSAANASLLLGAAGVLCGVAIFSAAPWVARWFNNPGLAAYLPALALFTGLMLASATLEIVLVSRKRYGAAAVVYGSSDTVKALMFVVPALAFRSLSALMAGAVIFAAIRCATAIGRLAYDFGPRFRLDFSLMKVQLGYALPFAAAVMVEVIQTNLHQYAVASWFDRATFAIYSVGCLQIPLVELLSTSAANVMMVRMSEDLARGQSVVPIWHDTIERLAVVFFPLFAVVALCAREIIVSLFTVKYVASVPIFVVSSTAIVLAALPVEAVLRVYAQTRVFLVLNLIRLSFIGVTIAWFVSRFSLTGAALVTVTALGGAKLFAVGRIAQLMRVGVSDILPWRTLARVAAAAVVAVPPALLVRAHEGGAPLIRVLYIAAVYVSVYAAILSAWWVADRLALWPAVRLQGSAEGQ